MVDGWRRMNLNVTELYKWLNGESCIICHGLKFRVDKMVEKESRFFCPGLRKKWCSSSSYMS